MVAPAPTIAPVSDFEYNPYAFSVHEDPYAIYRRLRDEAPVFRNDDLRFWALSRFDDVHEAFRDHETFISSKGIALETRTDHREGVAMMIETDPPEHTVLRKLVSRVFTGRKVAEMEGAARSIVTGYIDEFIADGKCDLVGDLTGPFPMDVISEVLGVPESDRADLRVYADKILIREDGSMDMPEEAAQGIFDILSYFSADLPHRRAGEGTGLFTDLAQVEIEGRRLTNDELVGFCLLFVVAGHETTTKMIANAIELLSRHPDQREEVVADPSVVPDVVEEVLRFHNSTQYMHRTLSRDLTLHGVDMAENDSVLLVIGAANHDEREYGPTAEEFDIHRRPERHLSFGYGAHFCLGAALARMEGTVALEEIHRRMPDYEVDHDNKMRFHSGNVTGWSKLPLSFTPT